MAAAVERGCAAAGLARRSRGTLTKYPGCVHWHYELRGRPGTLEITYWPKKERLWIKIHPRRRAGWMDEIIPRVKNEVETCLRS